MTSTTPLTRRAAREALPKKQRTPQPAPTTSPPALTRRPGFRPDIEGLRAIAILLVVLYHCGITALPGGYIGVDVFFVISGYLITSHLAREARVTGRLHIGRFYARRALRLLPAATLVIASTLIATWYWAPATRMRTVSWDALSANGYVINYRLAQLGTDYRTADSAPSPLQHFWSLAVEEQFYLVIPLLLLLTAVLMRRRTAFTIALGAATAASLIWSVLATNQNPVWAYYGAASRGWELGAGALLAMGIFLTNRIPAPALTALRWLGLAAIAYAATTYTDATPFPSFYAALPVAGAMAVIAAGVFNPGTALCNPAFLAIGARSYSWYLWHWPLLMLAPYALSHELNLPSRLGAALVALGLAALTYELFETPMRENRDLRDHPLAAGRFCLILTVGVAAIALVLPHLPPRQPLGMGTVAELTLNGTGSAQEKVLMAQVAQSTNLDALPANLVPPVTEGATSWPQVYADKCHLNFPTTQTPKRCEKYGAKKAKTVIALFGDSHAAQWFPALQQIAKDNDWRLASFTKAACSPADITIYLPESPAHGAGPYNECNTWRATTIRRLQKLKPSMIVIGSRWREYANGLTGSDDQLDAAFSAAYQRTARSLQSIDKTKIVYVNDSPWMRQAVPDCLAIHPRDIQECGRTYKSATDGTRRTAIVEAFTGLHLDVIDSMPWFCSLQSCPPVIGNYLVYTDTSHITPQYATFLAPLLKEALPPLAKRPTKHTASKET